MSEENTTPGTPAPGSTTPEPTTPPTPTPPTDPNASGGKLLAGKFQDENALFTGYANAREKLGLPKVEGKLVGPDGLFTSTRAVERAYADLAVMIRKGGGKADDTPPPADPPADPPKNDDGSLSIKPDDGKQTQDDNALPDDAGVDQVLERAGLKNDDIVKQWSESGKLTDEQYAALKKVNPGYTRAVVDAFIQGQQAAIAAQQQAQQQIKQQAVTMAGGEQQLGNLFQWAARNVPKEQLGDPDNPAPGTINHRLADPHLYQGAIRELLATHSEAVGAGKAQALVHGGTAPDHPGGSGFTTAQEMRNAMEESRKKYGDWKKDAALLARIKATPYRVQSAL